MVIGGGGGGKTYVTFNNNSSSNITAWGGGVGGQGQGGSGGCGGGGGYSAGGGSCNNYSNNYGNSGGAYVLAGLCSGGGGAGAASIDGINATNGGAGGVGIKCSLPGIDKFAPSGISYGTYYWGGGGGGSANSSAASVQYGNGGLGGGGGGGTVNAALPSATGGGSALNPGGNGINDNSLPICGNGGANTGGGGGGGWRGTAGGGGSGIVIIAFPQTVVLTNSQAVLTSAQVANGGFIDVMTMQGVSSPAYQSIKGGFACCLINYDYFGPIMTLRYSSDVNGNYIANFYADVFGNLGTEYLGMGTALYDWLYNAGANTTYAYVTKWYNQGMDICFNSATLYVLGSQPIYDVSSGLMNFGYTGTAGGVAAPQNGWFNLPNGAYPLSPNATADCSYAYIVHHRNYNSASAMTLFSGGLNTSNYIGNGLILNYATSGYYYSWWQGSDLQSTSASMVNNNVVSTTFVATGSATFGAQTLYVNGTTNGSRTAAGIHQQNSTNNYIGNSPYFAASYQFQMYNFFFFSTALTQGTDRAIIEATATPLPFRYISNISNINTSSISTDGFTVSWLGGTGSGVTTTYTINGSVVNPSSSSTGTATFSSLPRMTSWALVITANSGARTTTGNVTIPYPISIIKTDIGYAITFTCTNLDESVSYIQWVNNTTGLTGRAVPTTRSTFIFTDLYNINPGNTYSYTFNILDASNTVFSSMSFSYTTGIGSTITSITTNSITFVWSGIIPVNVDTLVVIATAVSGTSIAQRTITSGTTTTTNYQQTNGNTITWIDNACVSGSTYTYAFTWYKNGTSGTVVYTYQHSYVIASTPTITSILSAFPWHGACMAITLNTSSTTPPGITLTRSPAFTGSVSSITIPWCCLTIKDATTWAVCDIMTLSNTNYTYTATTNGTTSAAVSGITSSFIPRTVNKTYTTSLLAGNYKIFTVAGGGGGGGSNGPGSSQCEGDSGGAGGILQSTIKLLQNETVTVVIGGGGCGGYRYGGTGWNFTLSKTSNVLSNIGATKGGNTTINFSNETNLNIFAYGGGAGGDLAAPNGSSGGSGGGGGGNSNSGGSSGVIGQGYAGAAAPPYCGGAGGGASSAPITTSQGGDGIKCSLAGISTLYPNYYFGGGGGAGTGFGTSGNSLGGIGGGGPGPHLSVVNAAGTAINLELPSAPISGANPFYAYGGHGGLNTGGGGGGTQRQGIAGGWVYTNSSVILPQTWWFPQGGYGGCGYAVIYNTDTGAYTIFS